MSREGAAGPDSSSAGPEAKEIVPALWQQLAPRYRELASRELTVDTVESWLHDWSELTKDLHEARAWLKRRSDEDTGNEEARREYLEYVEKVAPEARVASQQLILRLVGLSGYTPPRDLEPALRQLRNEGELFRSENVPLLSRSESLNNEFLRITGSIAVRLDGEEHTIPHVRPRLLSSDRNERERVWRAINEAQLEKAEELDELFLELVRLRSVVARNAGFSGYREYRWRELNRFDYSPDDSLQLDAAIEQGVVPVVSRRLEDRRRELGVDVLRPWDLLVDPASLPPLRPFDSTEELESGLERIFSTMDARLGAHFALLREGWMDLADRKGKVPGIGYQMDFPRSGRPYIYHSLSGLHEDVVVLLHEGGHAFHALERSASNDLIWTRHPGPEFAEVASQAMELLALPYLHRRLGGFYDDEEFARMVDDQGEKILRLFPLAAAGDEFQHWVYSQDPEHLRIADVDGKWLELQERYHPDADWSGLEGVRAKGWQFFHVYGVPFYLLDYAIAYLGAIQVWRNSLTDEKGALESYLYALRLGATRSVPELFRAAGATFSFDPAHVEEQLGFFEQRLRAENAADLVSYRLKRGEA